MRGQQQQQGASVVGPVWWGAGGSVAIHHLQRQQRAGGQEWEQQQQQQQQSACRTRGYSVGPRCSRSSGRCWGPGWGLMPSQQPGSTACSTPLARCWSPPWVWWASCPPNSLGQCSPLVTPHAAGARPGEPGGNAGRWCGCCCCCPHVRFFLLGGVPADLSSHSSCRSSNGGTAASGHVGSPAGWLLSVGVPAPLQARGLPVRPGGAAAGHQHPRQAGPGSGGVAAAVVVVVGGGGARWGQTLDLGQPVQLAQRLEEASTAAGAHELLGRPACHKRRVAPLLPLHSCPCSRLPHRPCAPAPASGWVYGHGMPRPPPPHPDLPHLTPRAPPCREKVPGRQCCTKFLEAVAPLNLPENTGCVGCSGGRHGRSSSPQCCTPTWCTIFPWSPRWGWGQ